MNELGYKQAGFSDFQKNLCLVCDDLHISTSTFLHHNLAANYFPDLLNQVSSVQAILFVPTKSIAFDLHKHLVYFGFSSVLCLGGSSVYENRREIVRSRPQILLGTPGRIK